MEKESNRKKNFWQYFFGGEILKEDFVIKQSKLLILVVILFIIFISNGYSCQKKLTQIEDLKAELRDVKYENLVISTRLTSSSRQSQIEVLLGKKGIDLASPTTPAFIIED
ncbi:MAG: hypothetical protein LBH12_04645 [Dysgonamonadaceae bacterium]|jgi:hypothetical protein|nr:hypothetical protein [Dysgonamonadaceae bacterium]